MAQDRHAIVLAAAQSSSVWLDREATIAKACDLIREAGRYGADIIGFPENYTPGHPSWFHYLSEGDAAASQLNRRLLANAVAIPSAAVESLCAAAAEAEIIVVMGLTELAAPNSGTMYNTQLYIGSNGDIIGKHQKLVATKAERLVHAPGEPETQRTFPSDLGGVSGLICGENSNPLALAMIGANYPVVHISNWPAHVSPNSRLGVRGISEMVAKSVAHMLGCFVISAAGVNSPEMIAEIARTDRDLAFLRDPANSGGSCIVGPSGEVIAGPMPGDEEGILYASVDVAECSAARLVLDFSGHYNRSDVYQLTVNNQRRDLVRVIDGAASPGELDPDGPEKIASGGTASHQR